MNDAATIIAKATGCTLAKARRAVVELVASGWVSPAAERMADSGAGAPMELTAVCEAIRQAPANVRLDIVTDSKNVIGWLTGTFKRNNPTVAALSAEIDKLRAGRGFDVGDPDRGIRFRHVLGHRGGKFNERADYLAQGASKRLPKGGR